MISFYQHANPTSLFQQKEYSTKKKKKKHDKSENRGKHTSEDLSTRPGYGHKNIAAGISLGVLSNKMAPAFRNKLIENTMSSYNTSDEDEQIRESLLKKAEDQGITVTRDPYYDNSAYDPGTDSMIIGGDDESVLNSPGVIAHELGHAQYMSSDGSRSNDFIAKGAHKLYHVGDVASSGLGIAASALHGYHSGIKSEKDKEKGKKETAWNKVRSVAVPGVLVAPQLIAEGSASVKGLKMMKEAGASKELINDAKGDLASAFGTYAAHAVLPVAAGYAGRLVGKGVARLKRKRKKKKEQKSQKK
jgi:hypothetical protein